MNTAYRRRMGALLLSVAAALVIPSTGRAEEDILQYKDIVCNNRGQNVAQFERGRAPAGELTSEAIEDKIRSLEPGTEVYKNDYRNLRIALGDLDRRPPCPR